MKAEDLFVWHYRNFTPYPQLSENCFLPSSFISLYSSALPNERMKALFRFVPSFVSSEIGGFLYICPLGKAGLSFFLFDILETYIHICIQSGFSKVNENILHLYSKLHLLYRCGLWNLRFLSCTSFVNLHSPSNYHTFIWLRVNEWRLQIFHLPSPSYFQEAEILTKSIGVLIISTCSITQMNCMCW